MDVTGGIEKIEPDGDQNEDGKQQGGIGCFRLRLRFRRFFFLGLFFAAVVAEIAVVIQCVSAFFTKHDAHPFLKREFFAEYR